MELIEICKKAKKVKYEIQCLTTKEKNDALLAVADKLVALGIIKNLPKSDQLSIFDI